MGGAAHDLLSSKGRDDTRAVVDLQKPTSDRKSVSSKLPGRTRLAPRAVHDVLRAPGRPLEPGVRNAMERCLGGDFSSVRVHTDERAAESARSVNALAYTVGISIAS